MKGLTEEKCKKQNLSEHKKDVFLTVKGGCSLLVSLTVALVNEGCEEEDFKSKESD